MNKSSRNLTRLTEKFVLIIPFVIGLAFFTFAQFVQPTKADDVGNQSPVVTVDQPIVTVDEGTLATNSGSAVDSDGIIESLTATVGTVIDQGDGAWSWAYTPADGPDDSQEVTITAIDDYEAQGSITFDLYVDNVSPELSALVGPSQPVGIGENWNGIFYFTDPEAVDTHSAVWDWGDGSEPSQCPPNIDISCKLYQTIDGEGIISGSHIFTTDQWPVSGIFTVLLTLFDDDGGSTEASTLAIVYDPEGGFVTGGGWFDSPTGAYTPDPSLTGKATFGFVSKYKKGADVPSGNTEFQFKVADLNFHADEYQWLVVAGHKAKFKGFGTINGQGNYGFMISAIDANLTPSTDVDLFRIKIWDIDQNDAVVYDNLMGADDNADPTTQINGSIIIHKEK